MTRLHMVRLDKLTVSDSAWRTYLDGESLARFCAYSTEYNVQCTAHGWLGVWLAWRDWHGKKSNVASQ